MESMLGSDSKKVSNTDLFLLPIGIVSYKFRHEKANVMKRLFITLLLAAMVSGCGINKTRLAKINSAIDSVKVAFVPDPRTAVFNVTTDVTKAGVVVRGEVDNQKAKQAILSELERLNEKDVVDSIAVLPEASLTPKVFGIVDVSVGNLYGAPRNSAELVDQVLLGHTVSLLKEFHGWYYVKSTPEPPLDKGYLGWIDTDNIVRIDSEAFASYTSAKKLIVTTVYSTIESSPFHGTSISDIVIADFLTPISNTKSFFEIQLPDGRTGYVSKSDVQFCNKYFSSFKATPDRIEEFAKKFVGFPYLWGGTSSKAMDCSGFVKTVFRMNGINLPRDASQQADVGEPVDPGTDFINLKKGDLLFFGQKADSNMPEKIAHVAIYLGGGYFVNSSSLVRINSLIESDSLFDHYELDRFVRARRILDIPLK